MATNHLQCALSAILPGWTNRRSCWSEDGAETVVASGTCSLLTGCTTSIPTKIWSTCRGASSANLPPKSASSLQGCEESISPALRLAQPVPLGGARRLGTSWIYSPAAKVQNASAAQAARRMRKIAAPGQAHVVGQRFGFLDRLRAKSVAALMPPGLSTIPTGQYGEVEQFPSECANGIDEIKGCCAVASHICADLLSSTLFRIDPVPRIQRLRGGTSSGAYQVCYIFTGRVLILPSPAGYGCQPRFGMCFAFNYCNRLLLRGRWTSPTRMWVSFGLGIGTCFVW